MLPATTEDALAKSFTAAPQSANSAERSSPLSAALPSFALPFVEECTFGIKKPARMKGTKHGLNQYCVKSINRLKTQSLFSDAAAISLFIPIRQE